MVKRKVGKLNLFKHEGNARTAWVLPGLAVLTFISSWAGVYPANLVETWYARLIFPKISRLAAYLANAFAFSWLDVVIPVGVTVLIVAVHHRRFRLLINL